LWGDWDENSDSPLKEKGVKGSIKTLFKNSTMFIEENENWGWLGVFLFFIS
jgi:hypothetical protein